MSLIGGVKVPSLFPKAGRGVSGCSCLKCGSVLNADDVNVAADTALCRRCGSAFRFSEVIVSGDAGQSFDLTMPPAGVSVEKDPDRFLVNATTRSAQAFFLIPFMAVWSGFSLWGLYGRQFVQGQFRLGQSLFGIPFLIGTVMIGSMAIMSAIGNVVVSARGDEGAVFVGVWPLGWTRRFRWADVAAVRQVVTTGNRGGTTTSIQLSFKPGTRPLIKFGGMLSDERRAFVLWVLRSYLQQRAQ